MSFTNLFLVTVIVHVSLDTTTLRLTKWEGNEQATQRDLEAHLKNALDNAISRQYNPQKVNCTAATTSTNKKKGPYSHLRLINLDNLYQLYPINSIFYPNFKGLTNIREYKITVFTITSVTI